MQCQSFAELLISFNNKLIIIIKFLCKMEWSDKYWIFGLGFFSQGLFAVRLLVQWFLSEKEGRVVSPVIFWQISVVACYLFFVYGILLNDIVIILGQGLAYIIYIR